MEESVVPSGIACVIERVIEHMVSASPSFSEGLQHGGLLQSRPVGQTDRLLAVAESACTN